MCRMFLHGLQGNGLDQHTANRHCKNSQGHGDRRSTRNHGERDGDRGRNGERAGKRLTSATRRPAAKVWFPSSNDSKDDNNNDNNNNSGRGRGTGTGLARRWQGIRIVRCDGTREKCGSCLSRPGFIWLVLVVDALDCCSAGHSVRLWALVGMLLLLDVCVGLGAWKPVPDSIRRLRVVHLLGVRQNQPD